MLVGRDRELAELAAALSRIATGGALYLFTGEPGIGKTRLAAEVASIARGRGVRASWGRCWEAGGAPPFWPWREALDGCGVAFPDAATMAAGDPTEARFALFREIASALGREAARQPLLIVLEDLHAADLPTLVLLEFVATQLRAHPIVVVGTYRDLEARLRPDAGDVLARLGRSGRALRLSALSEAHVAAILGDAIEGADARLAATVYEITHGNPLFVDEMVRDVRARGIGARGLDPARRARDHPPAAGAGLGNGAARPRGRGRARRRVSAWRCSVAWPATPRRCSTTPRSSGLVTAHDGRLRFSHSLYREGLYHELPRLRRQALHREAARALADSGASLEEIAHHLLESGPDAAAEAIDHAVRAAAHAVDVFAFEEADCAARARERGGSPGPAREPAALPGADRAGRSTVAERRRDGPRALCQGRGDRARARRRRAARPRRPGLRQRAHDGRRRSVPRRRARRGAGALARRGHARSGHASWRAWPRRGSRPRRKCGRATSTSRTMPSRWRAGSPIGASSSLVLHSASGALYGAADPTVRVPITREQERLAEELGDTTRLLHARVRLAIDYLELGDFASYEELATSYEALAQRIGPAAEPWRVPLMRSMLALRADRFDESVRWQDESRRIDSERPRPRRAQAFHRICFFRAAERHAELRASIPELRNLWLAMPYGVVLAEPRVASVLARIGADEEVRELARPAYPSTCCARKSTRRRSPRRSGRPATARAPSSSWRCSLPYRTRWMMYWFDCEITEAPSTASARLPRGDRGRLGRMRPAARARAPRRRKRRPPIDGGAHALRARRSLRPRRPRAGARARAAHRRASAGQPTSGCPSSSR